MAKYSQKLADEICEKIAAGEHKIPDICKQVGINKATFYHWKKTKSDFLEDIKSAEKSQLVAFKDMARSGLAVLLEGEDYEEVTTEYIQDPKKSKELIIKSKKVIKKRRAPNSAAVIYALSNVDKENFKNFTQVDHTTKGKPISTDYSGMSTEEIVKRVNALKKLKDDQSQGD